MNADPLADSYRPLEYLAFGRALETCRFHYLGALASVERVLIFGEGDGRFLAELLKRNQRATVEVVDSSARMLALARSRVADRDRARVCFIQADACRWTPAQNYDAVVTNFFLDCLTAEEAEAFIAASSGCLKPGGLWLVGEFHLPARGWRRWHAWLWLAVMYRLFAITTGLRARQLPVHEELLRRAGFKIVEERHWRADLLVAQLWRRG